jgi:hypothetical protein
VKIQDAPPSPEFTRGPALVPTDELRAWLEATRSDIGQRKIRLPVWFEMAGMTVKSTRIGAADGPDVVKVKLRDSALGVPLGDRARRAARDGSTPAMWLEGTWDGGGTFSVTRFVDVIPADKAAAATYVEIEARP